MTAFFSTDELKGDLCAVICHHENVGGSQFIIFAKHDLTGNWFEFDDQLVEHSSDIRFYFYGIICSTPWPSQALLIRFSVPTKPSHRKRHRTLPTWLFRFSNQ